jgi:hypothetical protein
MPTDSGQIAGTDIALQEGIEIMKALIRESRAFL